MPILRDFTIITAVGTLLLGVLAPRGRGAAISKRQVGAEWQAGFSRRSDLEFRRLLEKLPAAAYTCDANGLITYFNERAVELWGRAPRLNDPVDRFCGSFRLFGADGTAITHDACWMALALNENRPYNAQEIIVEREDGSRRTALAHANPIHDRLGRVTGAVNVLVDITDRKRAETVLQEADRAKNEFLAMLAHELRNPLAPMSNAVELMRVTSDEGRQKAARETIERQLQHLTRVVDDLLDLSRITRNALVLRRERVELAPIIEQALEIARPLAECAGHAIEVSLPTEPIHLHADGVRLAQLFSNLLGNACKYTDDGGHIRVAVERDGNDAVVSVRDDGIGISAAELPRVFDMFARSSRTARRSQDGLGIGLTLARLVAELHGGTIEAHSDGEGHGSEFRVRLPVLLAPEAEGRVEAPPTHREPARTTALRILVVDDNVDAATSLSELLSLSGHDCRVARDGASALRMAETIRPDVVFLDIGLPEMNGYDVARELRRHDWGRALRLVALTGWGQADDRARSRDAGFDHHLVKPVEYAVVESLLGAEAASV